MGLPRNKIRKLNENAGTVAPSAVGVAAILAPCTGGGVPLTNLATSWTSKGLIQSTFLAGPLIEIAANQIDEAELPVVLVKCATSTAAKYTGARVTPSMVASLTNGPPAVLTTVAPHGLQTGDVVTIAGATGDTAINGTYVVTVTGASTFSIPVTGSGSYAADSATVTPTGMSYVGTGTAVPSPGSAAALADDYNAVVTDVQAAPIPAGLAGVVVYFTAAGALGTVGITYVYSLDGGNSVSAPQALGTALSISLSEPLTGADTGIRITLGIAAATIVEGDYINIQTVGPRMTSADLIAALAALYSTKLAFDLILIHGETVASLSSSVIEPWVLTLNDTGRYPTVLVNTRFKGQLPGAVESETSYATAMIAFQAAIMASGAANDVMLGVDGGAYVSSYTGVTKAMPTSAYALARLESIPIGTDPAEVDLGPIGNCDLDNPHSTPAFHDEAVTNTLDFTGSTLQLTTLRSFFGRSGAYITNAYLLSVPGSDFVYAQDNRTMNAACALVDSMMESLLSKGVPRNLKTSTILEPTAAGWERLVQKRLDKLLAGQVSGTQFSIARDDVFTGNGPQTVHYSLKNDALAYVKNFDGTAAFVSSL